MIPDTWEELLDIKQVSVGDRLYSPKMWGANHSRIEFREIDYLRQTWVIYVEKYDHLVPWSQFSVQHNLRKDWMYIEKAFSQYDPTQAGDKDDDI